MSRTVAHNGQSERSQLLARGRCLPFVWLLLPSLSILLLAGLSTLIYLPARSHLDFTASQLNFTVEADKNPAGSEQPEILAHSVSFSSLVITHWMKLQWLEQPVAKRDSLPTTHTVALTCRGSNPKLVLKNLGGTAARLGLLARIPLRPNRLTVIAAPTGTLPAITLEAETSQELKFSILVPEFILETESCKPEGLPLQDFAPYRVKLTEGSRILTLTIDSQGLELTFTPADPPIGIFRKRLDLPLSSINLLGAEFEGKSASALRGSAALQYIDYPSAPKVAIDERSVIDLRRLSESRLKYLRFDAAQGAFRGSFEGKVGVVASRDKMFALNLFNIFRYSWYWIAVAACWLVSTVWAAFKIWRSTPYPQVHGALKTRILFLGVNPVDSTTLRLDEEVRAIDRALAVATLGSRCELVQKWAVRVSELQEYLVGTQPSIVHFSGHGMADRTIAFQDEAGATRPVSADRLARLLALYNQRLRCVVLNACYTKAHGEAIAEHIDCVVGMSTAVSDAAAIRFAAAFYLSVASGCCVEDAFERAKADIELGELGEDEIPSLVAKRCDPREVFLVFKA